LLWGAGFIAVGVLPLAFISARGGSAYLAPSVGWAVYAGGLFDWLAKSLAGGRVRLRAAVQAGLLVALLVVLAPWQRRWLEMQAVAAHETQARYRRYIGQIQSLIPAPRPGAHILLLSDAEGRDDYDVYFVIRLYFGDPKLEVSRMKVLRDYHVAVDDPSRYDYVLDWTDNRFVLAGHKQ
jgi:hypothetical protein